MATPEGTPVITPPEGTATPVVPTPLPGAPAVPAKTPVVPVVAGTTPPAEPKRVRLGGADDELPEDADLIEMSPKAFKSRVARASTAELKRRFGTDDLDEIEKEREELKTLRADKETRRLSELTEVEKERERANVAERRAEAAEHQAREAHHQREYERDDRVLTRTAEKLVDPDYIDAELLRFAKHLTTTYDKKTLKAMDAKKMSVLATEFLEERIKAKPKLAKDYETAKAAEIEAQLKKDAKDRMRGKAPVTNGSKTNDRPVDDDTGVEGKTFAPGKPNSMSDAEARKQMRDRGISYR